MQINGDENRRILSEALLFTGESLGQRMLGKIKIRL